MRQFTDNAGRSWTVTVNVDAVKRVRSMLDVDLLTVVDGTLIERLTLDPVLLCDVIYVVCQPEAESKGVSDAEFGRAMAGDAIEHATKALIDELVGFLPNPRDRATLGTVIEKARTAQGKMRDLVDVRIRTGAVDRVIERELAKLSQLASVGDGFTSAPESSALTPADSLLAS